MNKSINIVLRELEIKDLEDYLYLNHPSRELKGEKNVLKDKRIIANKDTDKIIGQVNWYWKSEETLWMEIGIVIFNDDYWGQGIGYKALKMWIDEVFAKNPKLIRIGLSTWSGNERMMKLAEKVGLKKEAVYRKARIVDNKYYDSVSYGILKEEWEAVK